MPISGQRVASSSIKAPNGGTSRRCSGTSSQVSHKARTSSGTGITQEKKKARLSDISQERGGTTHTRSRRRTVVAFHKSSTPRCASGYGLGLGLPIDIPQTSTIIYRSGERTSSAATRLQVPRDPSPRLCIPRAGTAAAPNTPANWHNHDRDTSKPPSHPELGVISPLGNCFDKVVASTSSMTVTSQSDDDPAVLLDCAIDILSSHLSRTREHYSSFDHSHSLKARTIKDLETANIINPWAI